MLKIKRKNAPMSYYLIQKDTTETHEKGIYLIEESIDKKTGTIHTKTTLISTLIYLTEKVKSETAIFYKVSFFDNNIELSKYIKASDLLNDGYKDSDDFKFLINNGLVISFKCRQYVIDYLKCAIDTLETTSATDKAGWNKNNDYIGNGLNTSNIVFTGTTSARFEIKGNTEQYYSKLRTIFEDNPLVFSIVSYCASGFLLHFLRNEINQILAITGISSKGKSTVGKLALSMFTHPRYFRGMDATKYGMSLLAKDHKDNFVFFDENQESNLTQEQRLQFVYSLANASERLRATKFGDSFGVKDQEEQPKYSILIAGEKSFLNGVDKTNNGLDARFLEIVLPESIQLWDNIKTSEEAESLNQFILDNHGHLAEPFITYIKNNHNSIIDRYEYALKGIRAEMPDSSPIIQRKARILAYTFITSLIIAELLYGKDIATDIADNSYNALKKALFLDTEEQDRQLNVYKEELNHIEKTYFNYFDIQDNSILIPEKQIIKTYLGFIKLTQKKKVINIISTKFSYFCNLLHFDEKLFLMYLKENNLLSHDKDSNTKKLLINGARARYYVIDIDNSFFLSTEEQEQLKLDEDYTPWN